MVFVIGFVFATVLVQESDAKMEGAQLAKFHSTRGASEDGKDVAWTVPAKALGTPKKSRKGWELYVSRGIGILVPTGSTALAEIRRRGGFALLRGKVSAVPAAKREEGDPAYVLTVREISRRKAAPK